MLALNRNVFRFFLISLLGLLSACSEGESTRSISLAPVVQISTGSVQGVVRNYSPPPATGGVAAGAPYSVSEYRGIPYALAPTGTRRWALPEPVTIIYPFLFGFMVAHLLVDLPISIV